MSDSIYANRRDKKLREKDGSAHCKPTFIRIVGELVLDLVLNLDIFDFVVLVIWRGETLPILLTSFSLTNLVICNLKIWRTVPSW